MSTRRTPNVELVELISSIENLTRVAQKEAAREDQDQNVLTTKIISEATNLLALLLLWERVEHPLTFATTNVDSRRAPALNLVPCYMRTKSDNANRVGESIARGGETYMTSEDMYRHLNMLENLVPDKYPGSHLRVDTIFFRVSAMVSGNQRMVVYLEDHIPANDHPVPGIESNESSIIHYTALTTPNPLIHEAFIEDGLPSSLAYTRVYNPNVLFVSEVKQGGAMLYEHLAWAEARMYASAKYLEKGIIRGAITNGHEWIFMILRLDEDGNGGSFTRSDKITIGRSDRYPYHILSPGPDIVAGILAYWMERSFMDLDENDWFFSLGPINELTAENK